MLELFKTAVKATIEAIVTAEDSGEDGALKKEAARVFIRAASPLPDSLDDAIIDGAVWFANEYDLWDKLRDAVS